MASPPSNPFQPTVCVLQARDECQSQIDFTQEGISGWVTARATPELVERLFPLNSKIPINDFIPCLEGDVIVTKVEALAVHPDSDFDGLILYFVAQPGDLTYIPDEATIEDIHEEHNLAELGVNFKERKVTLFEWVRSIIDYQQRKEEEDVLQEASPVYVGASPTTSDGTHSGNTITNLHVGDLDIHVTSAGTHGKLENISSWNHPGVVQWGMDDNA